MNMTKSLYQKGIAIIEILVSSVVIGVGVLGVAFLTTELTGTTSYNKARDEAVALANAKIEEFDNIMLESQYTAIASGADASTISGTNATFTRSWSVTGLTTLTSGTGDATDSVKLPRKKITVNVAWDDAQGNSQSVNINTAHIWNDPVKLASIATNGDSTGGTYTGPNEDTAEVGDKSVFDLPDDAVTISIPTNRKSYVDDGKTYILDADNRLLLTIFSDDANAVIQISGTVYYDGNSMSDLAGISSDAGDCSFPLPAAGGGSGVTTIGSGGNQWKVANYNCIVSYGWRGNIGILGLASNFSKTSCPDMAREYLRYAISSDNKFYATGITTDKANQDFLIATINGQDNCETKIAEITALGDTFDEPFNLVVENGVPITINGWISNLSGDAINSATISAITVGGHATDGTNCRLLNEIDGYFDAYTCTVPASLNTDPVIPWSGSISATLNYIANNDSVTEVCSSTLNFTNLASHIDKDDVVSGAYVSEVGCLGNALVNGSCGASDQQSFSSIPGTNLCATGSATAVSGSGPWSWSCTGLNGGTTPSCSATLTTDGACGSSDGQGFSSIPSTNLCTTGTASVVSGTGPWSWSCDGEYGGTNASCAASLIVNGSCGSSNNQSFVSSPSSNLCNVGTASGVSGTGPWSWTCAGFNSGTTDSCSAVVTANVSVNVYLAISGGRGNFKPEPTSVSGGACTAQSYRGSKYYLCPTSVQGGSSGTFSVSVSAQSGTCSNLNSYTYSNAAEGNDYGSIASPLSISCVE